jgi:hypothetical protein
VGRSERKENKAAALKAIRDVDRKLDKIREQIRALGWITLNKPIRDGWKKIYRIPLEYANDPVMGEIYLEMLPLFQNSVYCKDKGFMTKPTRKRRIPIPINLFPLPIARSKWKQLSPRLKKMFVWEIRSLDEAYQSRRIPVEIKHSPVELKGYFPKSIHMAEEVMVRNYITRIQLVDPTLESQKKELEDWMEHHQGWEILGNRNGRNQSKYWGKGYKEVLNISERTRLESEVHKDLVEYSIGLVKGGIDV